MKGVLKQLPQEKKSAWNQASNMLLPVEVLKGSFVLFYS